MLGLDAPPGHPTYRLSLAAIAIMAAIAVLATLAAPASAREYMPPKNHIFEGVSDLGNKSAYFDFTDAIDRHVPVMQAFTAWGQPLKDYKQRWKRTETRGMLSISTSPCYECGETISPRAIATGKGDGYLVRLNKFLSEWGRPTYIRLLPEMNGHWNPYSAFNADGSGRGHKHKTSWFRRAWRRTVLIVRGGPRGRVNHKLLRQGLPRIKARHTPKHLHRAPVAFIWCPQTAGSPDLRKNRPAVYWPGSRFVDWVSADIYGKYPNFAGLERFYKSRKNFPFVIGEWSPWDADNPTFVNQLHEWAESHNRVHMLVYFQGFGKGNPFLIQHYPASEEALRKQVDNKRYSRFAPHSARAGDKGSGKGHPGKHGGKKHHHGGGNSGGVGSG